MRIEINAGGLGRFLDGVSLFSNSANSNSASNRLIRTLNDVVTRTGNVTGGVGGLGDARQSIQRRITTEESRQAAIRTVWQRTNTFIDTARDVDNRVAVMVRSDIAEFFRVNPWLRPPSRDNVFQRVGRFFTETIPNAKNSIIQFVRENWKTIVAVVVIIALVAITVLTLGKALPAILAIGAAIKAKAGVGAAILAASKAIGATVGGKIAKFYAFGNLGMWLSSPFRSGEEKTVLDFARRIAPECRVLNFAVSSADNVFNAVNILMLPGNIANFASKTRNAYSALRSLRVAPIFAGEVLRQDGLSILLDTLKFIKDGSSVVEAFRGLRPLQKPQPINFEPIRNFRPLPMPIIRPALVRT